MRTLESICQQLVLEETQCKLLETLLPQVCPPCAKGEAETKQRKRSRWQECIRKERAGKKFDPEAIKQLAKLYREGKCP